MHLCRRPAVLDFGDKPVRILEGQYVLEVCAGRLMIQVWDEERSLSRRILSVDRASSGVLDCTVQRFGGAAGTLAFLDLDKPQTSIRSVRGARQIFAEQFRRMLHRQFPGWEIDSVSSALDLRRSFSALSPRATLRRGHQRMAALACPSVENEPDFLSHALLWFDYQRARLTHSEPLALCLFLPETAGNVTAQRLRWLNQQQLRTRIFRFNEHGMAGEVDAQDLGNLDTRLAARYVPVKLSPELETAIARWQKMDGVGCCPELGGAVSVRFRGLEFARLERSRILLGIGLKEELAASEIERVEAFAGHLRGLSSAELPAFGEHWFESAIRGNLQLLDPDLLLTPVHGQVLTFAGGERELIDLLAISAAGRLTVLELKVSEDIQLPMQGLDYWMRMGWHAERGELDGLFPGIALAKKRPKLLLVAPAFGFHPSNEIVLRYFSPDIEVERIGVNSEWKAGLKIDFRLRGAETPISHRGLDDIRRISTH